ncbi:MAG: anthranilate phosphoribosyltransferase [Sandaracinus sp.]
MSAAGKALSVVASGAPLDAAEMEGAMDAILAGDASPVEIAGLAMALRMRGETPVELAAAARAMRRRAVPAPHGVEGPILDTCGTGGDGAHTFNVSTVSALLVAAAGARVGKHGNRAVSSRAGSADVLEALGVALDPGAERVSRDLRELGIAFFFAPAFHAALRHAAPVRKELGVRTFFNLLGPLASPAGATHQLVGVFDPNRVRTMAEVGGARPRRARRDLARGRHSGGAVTETELEPRDFGLEVVSLDALAGGDAAENAETVRAILDGETGPRRTAVLLNAAAALVVAGIERDRLAARDRAAEAIDSGRAAALLSRWAAR